MSTSNSASAKLTIIGLDNGVTVRAQYNPKEVGIDKSVPWQKAPTSTGDRPELTFTSAEGRSMSFELFFDTYEQGTDVHGAHVADLLQLAMVMAASPEEKMRPTRVKILWGNGLPDSDTLRSHLYNLRKTIDKPFEKPLLHTVQSAGYRIADIEQPPA